MKKPIKKDPWLIERRLSALGVEKIINPQKAGGNTYFSFSSSGEAEAFCKMLTCDEVGVFALDDKDGKKAKKPFKAEHDGKEVFMVAMLPKQLDKIEQAVQADKRMAKIFNQSPEVLAEQLKHYSMSEFGERLKHGQIFGSAGNCFELFAKGFRHMGGEGNVYTHTFEIFAQHAEETSFDISAAKLLKAAPNPQMREQCVKDAINFAYHSLPSQAFAETQARILQIFDRSVELQNKPDFDINQALAYEEKPKAAKPLSRAANDLSSELKEISQTKFPGIIQGVLKEMHAKNTADTKMNPEEKFGQMIKGLLDSRKNNGSREDVALENMALFLKATQTAQSAKFNNDDKLLEKSAQMLSAIDPKIRRDLEKTYDSLAPEFAKIFNRQTREEAVSGLKEAYSLEAKMEYKAENFAKIAKANLPSFVVEAPKPIWQPGKVLSVAAKDNEHNLPKVMENLSSIFRVTNEEIEHRKNNKLPALTPQEKISHACKSLLAQAKPEQQKACENVVKILNIISLAQDAGFKGAKGGDLVGKAVAELQDIDPEIRKQLPNIVKSVKTILNKESRDQLDKGLEAVSKRFEEEAKDHPPKVDHARSPLESAAEGSWVKRVAGRSLAGPNPARAA